MRHDPLIAILVASALTVPVVLARAATPGGVVAGFAHAAWFAYAGGLPVVLAFVALVTLGVAATRAGRRVKEALGAAQEGRGRRAARHVMANATPAALFLAAGLADPDLFAWTAAGACAALGGSLADTVSGELGMLSASEPRLLLFGRRVPRGTDGGMTAAGLAAGVAAAAVVGGAVALTSSLGFWPAFAGSVAGSLCDSMLGATIERTRALGNEGVNFWSSAAAGAAGAACAWALAP
jgi:uncharacterized protein (TIGR00297 family)